MGQQDGDCDEVPLHEVTIREFLMADAPVTNAQYELFNPDHARYRGIAGVSESDDAAVVFVSWNDAMAYCAWLSEQEGVNYRLPTEAEWEYTCRAGSVMAYWMGNLLPEEHRVENPDAWKKGAVSSMDDVSDTLLVRKREPNPFVLHDLGLVEQWCMDWYGPYTAGAQIDPAGYATGDFKVTRGGSYDTLAWFLRSANRIADLPGDKSRLIGFRVVQAPPIESMGTYLDPPAPQPFFSGVTQANYDWNQGTNDEPFFAPPIPYVIEPEPSDVEPVVPFYKHRRIHRSAKIVYYRTIWVFIKGPRVTKENGVSEIRHV